MERSERGQARRRVGAMEQQIVGFHQDDEQHWIADLKCGHCQHVRHNPPWVERPWVVTVEGRASVIGRTLNCVKCDSAIADRSS